MFVFGWAHCVFSIALTVCFFFFVSLQCVYKFDWVKVQKTFKTPILKLSVCPQTIQNLKFKWTIAFRQNEYKSENLL